MENFILKAKSLYGNKYDYLLVDYKKTNIKVKIRCIKHNETFEQMPSGHLRGKEGCKQCSLGTTDDFIIKAKEIHEDKYDYSFVEYKNTKTKIKIICKIHGEFEQLPTNHLHGQGCNKCGKISQIKKQTKTKEEFIKEAKGVHGDIYDYSFVEYQNSKSKIKIICKLHGEFEQEANAHLQGQKCKKCFNENQKCTKENIIERAIKIHGDKYNYTLVDYVDTKTKIKIICKIHGEFEQLPLHHIVAKQGCKKCTVDTLRSSKEEFIEKANKIHESKYDYTLVNYIDSTTKIKIICKIHGEFEQRPNDHLAGSGCRKCITDKQRSSKEEFIKKAKKLYGDKYDYSLVEYKTNKTKVKIICKIHGIFEQKPNDHLGGHTCLYCSHKTEGRIKTFFIKHKIKFDLQSSIDNKRFDFLIDDNYILEIDGRQHFPHLEKQNTCIKRDRNDILQNDIQKMESIIVYYPIVRLFQEHIWDNKYDWGRFSSK